jgi:hypothetical protein
LPAIVKGETVVETLHEMAKIIRHLIFDFGRFGFVRALPNFAKPPVDTRISQRIKKLASGLDRTEFEIPDGMTDVRFWPMGIGGRPHDPLADTGDRLLVVYPFVSRGRLEELAEGRKEVIVVSAVSELARLARKPKGVGRFYGLTDRAIVEVDSENEAKP